MAATPRLAITPGEPAGIGPEIVVRALEERGADGLVVIADPGLMNRAAKRAGSALRFGSGGVACEPVALAAAERPGTLDARNGGYVVATLERAVDGCISGAWSGLVTAPVHKGIINDAGIPFTGHTELLAERTGAEQVVMMLAAGPLRVALVTTHLSLAEVPAAITRERVERVVLVVDRDLRTRFGIERPRISLCGLNPHAGEGGHLGREEIEIIEPACDALRNRGIDLVGPLPADTAFTPRALEGVDAVVAMYHDQGLPVLKHAGFGTAVNVTLGLPIVRTSVDHGTALDLAGTGKADHRSLLAALDLARTLAGG
ncbi:MAG: 4-hydroxythreonine-4-phosphate dehydrogenase PdxA [Pseudomonadota bacterium]